MMGIIPSWIYAKMWAQWEPEVVQKRRELWKKKLRRRIDTAIALPRSILLKEEPL